MANQEIMDESCMECSGKRLNELVRPEPCVGVIQTSEETPVLSEENQPVECCPLLQGTHTLKPEDLEVYEYFGEDDGQITFCLDLMADEQMVFGKELSSQQEDSYAVIYGTYDAETGQVCETLDIEQRLPHNENWFCCKLTDEVRESLRHKMDAFYMEMCGERLSVLEQGETPPPQINQTM